VTEEQYPETGITEETRQMYPETYSDKYNKVFKQFIDDIVRPNHIEPPKHSHDILLDELAIMYEASMEAGGEQARFNASVIRAAINCILTCTK
jgi:hypothetical protein